MTGALTGLSGGQELILDRSCSVQFVRPIRVRVIREMPLSAPWHMAWLEVFELTSWGDARRRREVLVLVDGVRRAAEVGHIPRQRGPKPNSQLREVVELGSVGSGADLHARRGAVASR